MPQVVVFVPFPRPAPNILTMGSSTEYSTTEARPPPTWNDDLDRRLWSCASLYPHNFVQWDVVARKLNTSPDQCIIRFLHLYQQQLHRQLLAQRRPSRGAVMSVPSPSSSLSSSPSSAITGDAATTASFGSSPYSAAAATGRSSSSSTSSSLSSSPAGSQHFTAPNYLSSSPSQQAPLFTYAAKYAQQHQPQPQPPLSGGSSGSGTPVGSPAASSFLGKHKSGEQGLSRMTWPSKREFFDCVERLNFEWLSIGRALNQNPYECRQMYLSYAEGASPQPPDGIVDSLDQLAASHDPLFGLYDADSVESPQLFQPLHPQSLSPTFALDEEAGSPAPARRGTGGSGGTAANRGETRVPVVRGDEDDDNYDDDEQGDAPWLPSASIDQSTLASAFMSTFLTDGAASDE